MVDKDAVQDKLLLASKLSGVSPKDVSDASSRIASHVTKTPLVENAQISSWINQGVEKSADYVFKLESQQKTGSFKFRGAVNAVAKAEEDGDLKKVIVVSSSGNYGAAVSAAARLFNRQAMAILPNTTYQSKIQLVEKCGGQVILCEPSLSERRRLTKELAKTNDGSAIDSALNPDVTSGQGTVAVEILKEMPDIDAIVASIGSGGLIGGMAIAAKAFNSNIKIIGVEPECCDSAAQSLQNGYRTETTYNVNTLADSLKVSIGPVSWPIIQHLVDDVIRVNEEQIREGTEVLLKGFDQPIEGAAGAAVAATRTERFRKWGFTKVAVVICGGNTK